VTRSSTIRGLLALGLAAAPMLSIAAAQSPWPDSPSMEQEKYEPVPMPSGFQVVVSEQEGPVFADARGHTLYQWPVRQLRNGPVGERKSQPSCDDTKYTVNSGLMSPYPGGFELPEVETRPSCLDVWPAVLAEDDATPVDKWTIAERKDGTRQWVYDGYALYTSVLDDAPGEVNGAISGTTGEVGARRPVQVPSMVPPQFRVETLLVGRILTTDTGQMVYASEQDAPDESRCDAACLEKWAPILAPAYVTARGDFSAIERAPGIRQWTFRKQPLYTYIGEPMYKMYGSDEPGWDNVYVQYTPKPPAAFTVQESPTGLVLADKNGMTVYRYNCVDDALDQLACDYPEAPQAYRFTVCGGGDVERCLESFPYVEAEEGANSDSQLWSVMWIDPMTGKRAMPDQAGALRVWAYRERPIYTHFRDKAPGDMRGDTWGEFYGYRNGYKAFWLRSDFGRRLP